MGRSVADTRTAMTTLLNYGMSLGDAQNQMKAVSGLAATMGTSQEQAASTLVRAYEGQGRALKVLGLNISDFKDKTTGAIDKQKLFAAIMEKTSGAAEGYANSTQGQVQKFNNAMASIKTDFGKFLINAITPLLPVVQGFLGLLNSMPGPLKTVAFSVMGLVAAFGLLAGPIRSVLELMMMMDVTGAVGGAEAGAGGILGKVINKIGLGKGTGAKVAAATAEAEVVSVSLSGLGSAIMGMVAPLLVISGVIAIMIPVVAGLAAEALLFAKGIQLLIKNLHFEDIDLSGAVESLKQLGSALIQLTGVMVGMSLASVSATLATVFTGLLNGIGAITDRIGDLKKIVPKLNELKDVGKVDEGAVNNLKSIAEGLAGLKKASDSLTGISIDELIKKITSKITGDDTTNIGNAVGRLTTAANTLNQFKNVPKVDEGISNNISSVANGLKGLSDALKNMNSINWENLVGKFLSGGQNKIGDAVTAVQKAAQDLSRLKRYTGANGVDNVLSGINRGLQSLKTTTDSLNKIPPVGEGAFNVPIVAPKIQNAATHLSNIKKYTGAIGADTVLSGINRGLISLKTTVNNLNKVPGTAKDIGKQVAKVRDAATHLAQLKNYKGVSGVDNILSTVNNALNQLQHVLTTMNSVMSVNGRSMGGNLVNGLRAGLAPAPSVLQGAVNNAVNSSVGPARDGGARLGNELKNGFENAVKGLSNSLRTEITTMLSYLDGQKDQFRRRGEDLANSLKSGFESVHINTNVGAAGGGADSYSYGRQVTNHHNTSQSRIIHVHEGAINVDARNKTVAEAQAGLTLALENIING